MANFEKRRTGKLPSPGPFLAEVRNHLDPTYMGNLEVALFKGIIPDFDNQGETYVVRYCSPFAGNTSVKYEGTNPSDFNDVQKSYGWWAVPPDIGATVMVIFIDGDPNQGYWIGCVTDMFQNHMIPGIAASRQSAITDEQKRKYGTDLLPVAEFHKTSRKFTLNVEKLPKPVHPFADRLLQQGLLLDTIRGVTSSSARREIPSGVFGISTPGPIDDSPGAKRGEIGYQTKAKIPVSRLGGTTFVMDDGDVNGQNELVRLRTRTGHQILLHNSQDLIYIGNSKGTAWIELTSNGKIDIFAQDSISIHTENDFNFRADRDINLEAGRNIHIRADNNMETNVCGYHFLTIDKESKISIKGSRDETVGQTSKITVQNQLHFNVEKETFIYSGGDLNFLTDANTKIQSGINSNIKSGGQHLETAGQIHMNGPAAASSVKADDAEVPPDLPLFSLPNRKSKEGWTEGKFYKSSDLKSIMQRVPTHEPWDQHENINPPKVEPPKTDVTLADRTADGIAPNPLSKAAKATGRVRPSETPVEPTNPPVVEPGTCSIEYAKLINSGTSGFGIDALKTACEKYGLTSPYAVASVLGICGGETLWKVVEENFNYKADRLLEVFPSIFRGNRALAEQYAGNPNNSLPEFLYGYQTAKGKELGNKQPGDGAKFIGRGYVQLTGRANYERYAKLTNWDIVSNPKLLNRPDVAAEVTVKYFLDRVKRKQDDPGYFEAACKAVGYNTADIKAKKQGLYECFLGQLQGKLIGTGSGGIVTDSQGNPIRTGSGS